MSGRPAGFRVELPGSPLELEGWASLEHLGEDQAARELQAQVDHATMYRLAFSSNAGRYVLQDLMQLFLLTRIVRPGDDQFSAGIRQGQADVVQRILAMIEFANTGGGRPTGPGATTQE